MKRERWEIWKNVMRHNPYTIDNLREFTLERFINEIEYSLFGRLSVIQPWLEFLPLRMQSVLLLSARGPDTHRCPEVKKLTRWIRGLVFVPGNPDNVVEFMFADLPPRISEKSAVHRELEFTSQHFYSHLMHGLEVIGYKHPDSDIRSYGFYLYEDMCSIFHLPVEPVEEFEHRLRQMGWPGGTQPRDGREAFELIQKHQAFSERDKNALDKRGKDFGV